MIFLDTSAIFALADKADAYHNRAQELLRKILGSGQELFTHNYILIEAGALLHRRLGRPVAVRFLEEAKQFNIVWIEEQLHERAADYFSTQKREKVSLVDCMSFLVMEEKSANSAFAFDDDFSKAGFKLYQ